MRNRELRAEIVRKGLFVYEVAAAMGVKGSTLSHYLMQNLSKPRIERIQAAILKAEETKKGLNNGEKATKL